MNGRIYSPRLGLFLSADPQVDEPWLAGALNPYLYVLGNPLAWQDSSGYEWNPLKDIVNGVDHFLHEVGKAAGQFVEWVGQHWKEVVVIAVVIVVTVACDGCTAAESGMLAGAAGGATSAAVNGGTVGDVLLGAFEGGVFGTIGGGIAETPSLGVVGQAGTQGFVSGVQTASSGGDFGKGFLVGALSRGFNPQNISQASNSAWAISGRIALRAAVNGTIAELNGDKFANGAMTGAFQQLWMDAKQQGWRTIATAAQIVGAVRAREATAAGLVVAATLYGYSALTGGTAKFEFSNGAIGLKNAWKGPGGQGITFGNVCLYSDSGTTSTHEYIHVMQYGAEGSRGFVDRYYKEVQTYQYWDAPLEREAYRY
jgi:hypothetical protein